MIKRLKKFVRKQAFVISVVSFVYNMLFSKSRLQIILGRITANGVFLRGTKISIQGENNKVILGSGSSLTCCTIYIHGDGCVFSLGGGKISNTEIYIEDNKSIIDIGKDFTMGSGHLAATEGKSIIIGNDCMFSNDIEIRNGDSHSIHDKYGQRINEAQNVYIGNHVWLAAHVRILKSTSIPDGCIVGNSSVVSSVLHDNSAIYGGIPVRLLRNDIEWHRSRYIY